MNTTLSRQAHPYRQASCNTQRCLSALISLLMLFYGLSQSAAAQTVSFGVATNFALGGKYSVAVGDFNSDGKPDLAVAGDDVLILLNTSGAQGSICGFKFNDLNANGVRNPNESGLADWTIKSQPDTLAPNPNPILVTTNSSGEYCFTNLADGHYIVSEVQQPSWNQTAPPGGFYSVTISGGNSITGLDFGNTSSPLPGSISGYKFHDINGNGMRDSVGGQMEPLLDGWTIQIQGPVNQSTTTQLDGHYSFTNIPAGTYTITEILQSGWIQTYPPTGTHTIDLQSGQHAFLIFGNTGTNSISGKKFNDINSNCIQDGGEPGVQNWVIKLEPGPFFAITDANGNYIFPSLGAGTYTLSEQPKQYWAQTCPSFPGTHTVTLTQGQNVTGINFGNRIVQFVQDLAVTGVGAYYPSPLQTPCCQQEMTYLIHYSNLGSIAVLNATLEVYFSSGQPVYISTPSSTPTLAPPDLLPGNKLLYGLPTPLNPGASGNVHVRVFLDCPPTSTPMIVTHIRIEPFSTDDIKGNNTQNHHEQVSCSYDPNDKVVIPQGCGNEGYITANDSLIYHIRFQNLGSGPAYHVVIRDILDTDLDVTTVENLGSSHSNVFEINGNELVWTFWGIVLPYADADEPGSHGYVRFKVKQLPNNPSGTVIQNHAGIYFDLNEPVITNTTTNTITTNPLPAANFTITPNNAMYDFTYTGGTVGAAFLWDFGYGAVPQTSSEENPSGIFYSQPGLKIVTLQVMLGDCISEPAIQTMFVGTTDTCIQPPSGMVGWWPLDETSGTTIADIVGGHNGTTAPGPIGPPIGPGPTPSLPGAFPPGMVGSSLFFGAGRHITVPHHPNLDPDTSDFTIDAWFIWGGGTGPIVQKMLANVGYRLNIYMDTQQGGGLSFEAGGSPSGGSALNYFPITRNQWHHVAGTIQRGSPDVIRLYLDGALVVETANQAFPPGATIGTNVDLLIGGDGQTPGARIAVDEVEIFNRALSQTEIQAIYNAGSAGKCKPIGTSTGRNHYKTWRVNKVPFSAVVNVQDQFMQDSLWLVAIEFLSNPVKKIHRADTFNITRPDDHLAWYRAVGRNTLLTVGYVNQFESTAVSIDSVRYLLVPTQKRPHAPPKNLDHYKAYRIKDPKTFRAGITLEDQFDIRYGYPELIDSLKPKYFLTPALKKMPPPMFDSVTHYVAYEIFPKRYYSRSDSTIDQFGLHVLQVLNSEFLLVPTRKMLSVSVDEYRNGDALPQRFLLEQSYPNPFNPSTTIEYHLPVSGFVKLSVYDILGREIAVLVNDNVLAGKHRVTFDASSLPSGVYFYRMQAGKFQETRKLILLK